MVDGEFWKNFRIFVFFFFPDNLVFLLEYNSDDTILIWFVTLCRFLSFYFSFIDVFFKNKAERRGTIGRFSNLV